MGQIFKQKMTAEIDGEFVVFLIGARINKPWKVHKWLPVALATPRFGLAEAARHVSISGARDSARDRIAPPVAAAP